MNTYRTIGLMSGTSCDGLDIALCRFEENGGQWDFEILKTDTIGYSSEWKSRLQNAMELSGLELARLDVDFGRFCGEAVGKFMVGVREKPLLVASHGHTVFHQPTLGLTKQIGLGSAIATSAQVPVVCDFRTLDVALGGQGAPLVPFGDQRLFSGFGYCLNLGGIANLSVKQADKILAFDICACNLVLNALALELGQPYDDDGKIARSGSLEIGLLETLNSDPFFHSPAPKSLGREWVDQWMQPLGKYSSITVENSLRTVVEHIAIQIASSLGQYATNDSKRVLVTGGGAYNSFLVERFRYHVPQVEWHIPSTELIDYKEALIFGFLGLMRWLRRDNALASATGAKRDSSGGCIYLP